MTRKEREQWVDIAKGIGLYFVVLGHLVTYGSKTFTWIFSFHMPLFFFLSGYVCRYEENSFSWKKTLKKNVKSLLLPFAIFLVIGGIVTGTLPCWKYTVDWRGAITQIFWLAQPENLHVGQIWFLVCLFISYLLFFAFLRITRNGTVWVKIIVAILLAYIGIYIRMWANVPRYVRLPWKIDVAFTAVIFLLGGYYCKRLKIISDMKRDQYGLGVIFFAMVCYLIAVKGENCINLCECAYGNPVRFYLAAASGILMCCCIGKLLAGYKIGDLFAFYGRNSLVMFSLHSFYLYFSEWMLSRLYNADYHIMANIPYVWCWILSILIYVGLIPLGYLGSKVKRRNV